MESQPILSVLVVAYQQEKTIASAVESALNQKAKGLEIIFSDDASDDGTYAIMKEAVSNYRGSHAVYCIRQPENLGLNQHLNRLIEIAKADRIMYMAGDDVSYSHRAGKVIEAFLRFDALLIHSSADTMDVDGKLTKNQRYRSASFFKSTNPLKVATSLSLYLGASGAFHKDLFRKYGPLPNSIAYEDLITGFRATLEGRVGYIDEPLLCYRINVGITKQRKPKTRVQMKKWRIYQMELRLAVFEQRLVDLKTFDLRGSTALMNKLKRAISRARAIRDFHTSGPFSGSERAIARIQVAISESRYYICHRA